MPLSSLTEEVEKFLSSEDAGVMCISGKWGVGKTYNWREIFWKASKNKTINKEFENYSYVSLFGITSIETFQQTIFQNSKDLTSESAKSSRFRFPRKAKSKKVYQFSLLNLEAIPKLEKFGPIISKMVIENSIQQMIVCIDDIERMSENLAIKDLFGSIVELKESKNCKIVIILNDEQLEEQLVEFSKYFEKVVDLHIKFSPSVQHNIDIAFPNPSQNDLALKAAAQTLEIDNIRILKKLKFHTDQITKNIGEFNQLAVDDLVQRIAALCWCKYSANGPEKKDLIGWSSYTDYRNDEVPEKRKNWGDKLRSVNVRHIGDLESSLTKIIDQGFCENSDTAFINQYLQQSHEEITAKLAAIKYQGAWTDFFVNFNSSHEQVNRIFDTFEEEVEYMSAIQLSTIVTFARDLEKERKANQLVDFYVKTKNREPEFFNLRTHFRAEEIEDEYLISKFKEKYQTSKVSRKPLSEIFAEIALAKHWTEQNAEYLSQVSVDEFYEYFSTCDDLVNGGLKTALYYKNVVNVGARDKETTEKVKEALWKIGEENPISRYKVENWIGPKPKEPDAEE